jgi:hypothetical protein
MGRLRLTLPAMVAVVAAALIAAPAASANTTLGPWAGGNQGDFETCGTTWANYSNTVTMVVSPENFDGSYNVTANESGTFTSLAGQSPGACAPDTTGGTTIVKNVVGHLTGSYKFYVTGGTFNPAGACDTTCETAAANVDYGPFVTAYFGGGAQWTAAVNDIVSKWHATSANSVLTHNSYTAYWPAGTFSSNPLSALGDISID